MSFPMPSWPRLAGILIALMPLVALANTEQVACPTLLMERECHDYQAALHQAQSTEEMSVLADKYAALLVERSRLCPYTPLPGVAEEVKGSHRMEWAQHYLGQ